jgi:integrase
MWTGCRTMEIGGLTFSELFLDVNVPYLDIKPNHIRRLKTLSSERRVPLTTDALDAIRAYLSLQNNTPSGDPVFPRFGRDGGMDPLSQNLRGIIRNQMQITDRRLVPYSTRHTLKDKMRVIRTPLALQLEIMGQENKTNRIAEGYGDGDPLSYLREELERAAKVEDWGRGAEFRTNIN